MADIELVIKIPEGLKKDFELEQWTALSCMEMKDALMNGTPLPKGHGRLIDEKEINTVVNGVFCDCDRNSPKTFLNVIHSQCIEVIGADMAESEEK